MLNRQRRLTLARPTAAPTATQLRAVLTLHLLLLQQLEEVVPWWLVPDTEVIVATETLPQRDALHDALSLHSMLCGFSALLRLSPFEVPELLARPKIRYKTVLEYSSRYGIR